MEELGIHSLAVPRLIYGNVKTTRCVTKTEWHGYYAVAILPL